MRKVVLNIHLVLGLLVASFLVILGLTGAVLAFEPEIDRAQHHETSYVRPGGRVLSLAEIASAIARKYPAEPIVAYLPSESPGIASQVILSRGIVSVNQYTGEVLGVRSRGQSFLGVVRALHVRLAMGDLGRSVIKWSSLGTLLSLLSGMFLWWPIKRMRVGGRWWSARFWYDLHSSIGFFSLIPGLLLAGTGVVLGFETPIAELMGKMSVREIKTQICNGESPQDKRHLSPDEAVEIATAQIPGTVPYRVQMPRYGGLYVIALDNPQNRITGSQNSISLDPKTGRIVAARFASELTIAERIMATSQSIHTGTIWGFPSKTIAAIVSLILPLQALSGLLIWLRRKGVLHST